MVFSLLLSLLLCEFEGTMVGPDGVDAHGAPGFAVDVIERYGLTVIGCLLKRSTLTLGCIVGRDEIGAGSAACMTERAVFLDKLKENDAFEKGFFQIGNIHNDQY